jgi:hypothetical protein
MSQERLYLDKFSEHAILAIDGIMEINTIACNVTKLCIVLASMLLIICLPCSKSVGSSQPFINRLQSPHGLAYVFFPNTMEG